jgi:predicted TIM-barrel fold metal-dependent hydrolase
MIIDSHAHLIVREWFAESWWRGMGRVYAASFERAGYSVPPEAAIDVLTNQVADSTGEKTLALMDQNGVDVKVLLPLDFGLALGEPPVDYLTQNRDTLAIAARHPDRFIGYFGADPRRKGVVEQLERAVNDWGAKGLKLHPTAGFYPDDECVYPLLEKANQLKIPVMCHTGPTVEPVKSKYARPLFLDTIAADFPDLTIIAAHLALDWWPELAGIGSHKTNLMCDFSLWQLTACGAHPEEFRRTLRKILDNFGAGRVMFGTDDPYIYTVPTTAWIAYVQSLADSEGDGITFSKAEIEAVLGGTAQKIHRL